MEDGSDNGREPVGDDKNHGGYAGGVQGGALQPQAGGGAAESGAGVLAASGGGKEAQEATAGAEIVPGVPGAAVPAVQTPGVQGGVSAAQISKAAEKPPQDKGASEAESGINKIGKNHFAAVYIPATEAEKAAGIVSGVVRFSDQEAAILTAFMRSADYEKTAAEVGIKADSVKRILRRPNLKRYILFQIRVHTVKDIDPDWAKAEILPVWAGSTKVTEDQKWAMNSIIKLVMPKGGGVQVNVQQNSVYGDMGREAVDAEWVNARAASAEGV